MKTKLFIATVMASSLLSSVSQAEDEGPALSYGKQDAHGVVSHTIDTLVTWARGEYAEHDGEGLFERFPQEGALIRATIELAQQLKRDAANSADRAQAQAMLFAAEATARYAAAMPHLLEDRLAGTEDGRK